MKRTWIRNDSGIIVPGWETPRGFMPIIAGGSHKDVLATANQLAIITADQATDNLGTVLTVVSYVIPANSLVVGQSFRFHAGGFINPATGAETFTMRIAIGAANLILSTFTIAAVVADKGWYFAGLLTCRAIGAGTTSIEGSGFGYVNPGTNLGNSFGANSAVLAALDSTANITLNLRINFSAAGADTATAKTAGWWAA